MKTPRFFVVRTLIVALVGGLLLPAIGQNAAETAACRGGRCRPVVQPAPQGRSVRVRTPSLQLPGVTRPGLPPGVRPQFQPAPRRGAATVGSVGQTVLAGNGGAGSVVWTAGDTPARAREETTGPGTAPALPAEAITPGSARPTAVPRPKAVPYLTLQRQARPSPTANSSPLADPAVTR